MRSLKLRLFVALGAGFLYPLIDLAFACRQPESEACVWGKAYLPLSLGVSVVLVGGIVLGLLSILTAVFRHDRGRG